MDPKDEPKPAGAAGSAEVSRNLGASPVTCLSSDGTLVVVPSTVSGDSEPEDPAGSAEVGTTSAAVAVTEAAGPAEVVTEPDEEPDISVFVFINGLAETSELC